MAALHKLGQWAAEVENEYFLAYQDTDRWTLAELNACVTIQRIWRSFKVRNEMRRMKKASTTLQASIRGHLGRKRCGNYQRMVAERERKAFFDTCAATIQKWWRGYWSRKYTHSFIARKQYMAAVMAKTVQLSRETDAHREEEMQRIAQEMDDRMHEEFWQSCKGRHHLVSTFVRPGVFNSPYAEFLGGIPSMDGIPVEEHLRDTIRVPGSIVLPRVTLERPVQRYTKSRSTLQADSPFYAVDDQRRAEQLCHKLVNTGDVPFVTTVSKCPAELNRPSSIHQGTPYEIRKTRSEIDAEAAAFKPFHSCAKKTELFEDLVVHGIRKPTSV
uniref:Uncharacterized protein n=1 Tax=Pyramimonas obovata TaxID=1411642 RepID=A0A7S0WHA7_9CHLO|mmetsp:Transcript_25464/g.55359  ORF Transcript_25464/g.55359 Transcript_25464/m.55359 type:complete len:329 (+) Transcript_25464:279-1265(+)|eukprot:CAMPEP_0118945396 /NCGR_PEP_ID=MMETSP1169-20130426/42172_1 /TAXON_ID=36882 /ORGANISM="Pyramimonas obovata, Strain CCMP722" /LENGTH=328 /DNA_ID=CAMNT_0006891099 /DNA_START=272 /DNA_END=1258 /DNA_ORIENTATION=-